MIDFINELNASQEGWKLTILTPNCMHIILLRMLHWLYWFIAQLNLIWPLLLDVFSALFYNLLFLQAIDATIISSLRFQLIF